MLDAITAWCERLKAERQGFASIASDIEFMCRAYDGSRHGDFWDFGVDRLIELLQARFVAEEQALNSEGCRHLLGGHHAEHERIFGRLLKLRKEHELSRVTPVQVHIAERELLGFLDEELAEHIFSSDDEARAACGSAGIAFP